MSAEDRTQKIRDTIHKFMLTDRLHRSAIELQFAKLGIHRTQHIVLMEISRCETPPTQSELAKKFEISPAAMTVTLQKLEKSGLIEREPQEGNNRANTIRLTESGRNTIQKTDELFYAVDTAMFENISDSELKCFADCLSKMEESLKNFSPEAAKNEIDGCHRPRHIKMDEDEEKE